MYNRTRVLIRRAVSSRVCRKLLHSISGLQCVTTLSVSSRMLLHSVELLSSLHWFWSRMGNLPDWKRRTDIWLATEVDAKSYVSSGFCDRTANDLTSYKTVVLSLLENKQQADRKAAGEESVALAMGKEKPGVAPQVVDKVHHNQVKSHGEKLGERMPAHRCRIDIIKNTNAINCHYWTATVSVL